MLNQTAMILPLCPREEWQWLQALSSLDEMLEMDQDVQSAPHRLLQDLRSAIKDLMAHINVPGNQVRVSQKPCSKLFIFLYSRKSIIFVISLSPPTVATS